MARLKHAISGDISILRSVHRVGRGPHAHLRVRDGVVSSEHAAIRWTGHTWEIRDLGSRNGTFVNGERVEIGAGRPLAEGQDLAFGQPTPTWRVLDVSAPCAMAVSGAEVRLAEDGLIALPGPDDPQVCVVQRLDGTWSAESATDAHSVRDGETVRAGGRAWVLDLGGAVPPTRELAAAPPRLAEVTLVFKVSRDEEHVDLEIRAPSGDTIVLEHRAHAYLLLTLARERQDAISAGLPAAEQGWLYSDELALNLNMPMGQFNMAVYRARQQLERAGVLDAHALIERRRGSGQLRIGAGDVRVEPA